MYDKIPKNVKYVIEKIESYGFKAYIVGGCVRDILLGIEPNDFDVTTNALPEDIKGIFDKTVDVGLKHGTVTVICGDDHIEVTTFRTESEYNDLRHPEKVYFVDDVKLDLARRDFTVNAMAYGKQSGVIDPFGGRADLENRLLRAVGDPAERFSEDALRIMRLFRFASVLGFDIDKTTLDAALKASPGLNNISSERIAAELKKAVCGSNVNCMSTLIKSGALKHFFLCYDRLENIEKLSYPQLKLFAFLLLCSSSPIETAALLKLSNKEITYITDMIELLSFTLTEDSVSVKYALRESDYIFNDFLEFSEVIFKKDTAAIKSIYKRIRENNEPYRISDLKINGNDIIKSGFNGRLVGYILNFLLDKVIEDPTINTKEKLLKIIKN